MANWNNEWSSLNAINNNNQFTNNDVPTADTFNKTINNVGYLYNQIFDSTNGINKKISNINTSISNINNSITTINTNITNLGSRITNVGRTINNFLEYEYDGEHYCKIENDGLGITITTVDTYDYYKGVAHINREDIYIEVLGGANLDERIAWYGMEDFNNRINTLNNSVTTIQNKFNTLNGNDIKEANANANSITSTGLYAVSFYISTLTTVTYTAVLNITNLNSNFAVTLNCGIMSNSKLVEIFYSGTNQKITANVESGIGTLTATITSVYKIAKIS